MHMMYLKHIHPSPSSSQNLPLSLPSLPTLLRFLLFVFLPLCLGNGTWECVWLSQQYRNGLSSSDRGGVSCTPSHFHAGILTGSSLPRSSACCRNHHLHMCNRPVVSGKHCFLDFSNYLWLLESFQHQPPPRLSEKILSLEGRGVACVSHLGHSTVSFSAGWPVKDLCVTCHLREASPMKIARCSNLQVKQYVIRIGFILCPFSRIITCSLLGPVA